MKTPNGLQEIKDMFGDITNYIVTDGTLAEEWHDDYLTIINLPFSMPLSWDKTSDVSRITCHKLLAPMFVTVFAQIKTQGLDKYITDFGGCFSYRPQRTSINGSKLSTHAWGIAIDLNPNEDEQGTAGSMPQGIIDIFKANGFEWGGIWEGKIKDPMHFQFATGY